MTTRYNYKWTKPERKSCPIKEDYELIKILEPISFNEDKSIKEYKEKDDYKVTKTKWHDFIQSYNLGSVSEQVIEHLTKGTPLITAHTLPDGDYTSESLKKGAAFKRELASKGLTLDMLIEAVKQANAEANASKKESEVVSNG